MLDTQSFSIGIVTPYMVTLNSCNPFLDIPDIVKEAPGHRAPIQDSCPDRVGMLKR